MDKVFNYSLFFSVGGGVVEGNRFKIGRWKISSQSLDGQKLDTSQWILPKLKPSDKTVSHVQKSSRFLNAFQLENPSGRRPNSQGKQAKPILSKVWLPKTNSVNKSPIFDGKVASVLRLLK